MVPKPEEREDRVERWPEHCFYHRGLRLLLFGGKGGTGKTTCATAAALALARSYPQAPFLLVSTDPAHSLADSLAGCLPPANLTVLELNAQESLAAFKAAHGQKLREIAWRGTFLDDEDISRFLDLSLPGLDELMAFLEISGWVEARRYFCIIVDTAPTGHSLSLLRMPELLGRWLAVLDGLLAKHRYLQGLFHGSRHRDHLDRFLEELTGRVQQMAALLQDPTRCRFVPVMLAEELSVRETLGLLKELQRLQVPVSQIVVNRLYPESPCPACAWARSRQRRHLNYLARRLAGYSLWGVPLYPQEVRGPALQSFWQGAAPLAPNPCRPDTGKARALLAPACLAPRVENPGELPWPGSKFLLFAGKGGVGKTTLACATAVRLAQDPGRREVLLFSTDPAHSLSACLDVPLGPRPAKVAPGLTALELDAPAELQAFKAEYATELERLFQSFSPHLDLPFDRQAMESLMELTPPGLEEIMALTRVMELLALDDRYQVFILDTSPTGHLIRLLEMPELIDQWLKVFFEFLLKYRRLLRLPRLSQDLVHLSKNLKRLRSLLIDPHRSALFAVAIPTEMALQETRDLVAACEGLGLRVPALLLNQATPANECPLCSALHQREGEIRARFRQAFLGKQQTVIYRGDEPRCLERLGDLGQALYRPGRAEASAPLRKVVQL
jgi:arsenite-transporting ATPase